MDQKTAAQVLDRLQEEYPDARCALDHENVFQLLVSTMLSAQTTDKRVNMVAPALYAAFPDAASLAEADREQVEECIHSIGLYKNKAKNIIAMARKLEEEFGGQVPADRKLLMSLPGVGQKQRTWFWPTDSVNSALRWIPMCSGLPIGSVWPMRRM